MKVAAEPLCTSIEPVTKAIMCQRTEGHSGMHWAVSPTGDGKTTVEWQDAAWIRNFLFQHNQGEIKNG